MRRGTAWQNKHCDLSLRFGRFIVYFLGIVFDIGKSILRLGPWLAGHGKLAELKDVTGENTHRRVDFSVASLQSPIHF
jgi:hypothetical protein